MPPPETSAIGPVLLVDDHVLLCDALAEALARRGIGPVVSVLPSEADDDAVVVRARSMGARVALVDLSLGGGRSGLSLIGLLAGEGLSVIVVTASQDRQLLGRCLGAGAAALIDKASPLEGVAAAVVAACAGHDVMPDADRARLLAGVRYSRGHADPFATLSDREAEVLRGLLAGCSSRALAAAGGVSVNTVRTQLKSLFRKLDVNSRLAAVALARQAGWPPG